MCQNVNLMPRRTESLSDEFESALLERWQAAATLDSADSTTDAVRATLRDAIVSRDLAAGVRLGEERLAILFGVSRTPVREALVGLVNSNLAVRDSRGFLRVGSVTSEQILEVYAIREVLEGFAAAAAAHVAAPPSILRLRELNAAGARSAERGNFKGMAEENLQFHAAVAATTGNRLLMRFVDEIHSWVSRIPSSTLSYPGRAAQAIAQHEAIIRAIEERDTQRAERLAREHMESAEALRIAMLVDSR